MYSSDVEYPDTSIAKKLKGIAQVHMANFGTRVFYVDHGSFDSHSNQTGMHDKLWFDVSHALDAFLDDLKEHNVDDNVVVLMFTEFGRRTHDNGSGTDHGAGGAAFMFGTNVKGRTVQRVSRPWKRRTWSRADVVPNYDYRGLYSTVLEDWMGLDAKPLVGGLYEKLPILA